MQIHYYNKHAYSNVSNGHDYEKQGAKVKIFIEMRDHTSYYLSLAEIISG